MRLLLAGCFLWDRMGWDVLLLVDNFFQVDVVSMFSVRWVIGKIPFSNTEYQPQYSRVLVLVELSA